MKNRNDDEKVKGYTDEGVKESRCLNIPMK
jgi:hypothetical protein